MSSPEEPTAAGNLPASPEFMRYLAAGQRVNAVTHDVNNYLGAILAYADLVRADQTLDDNSQRMLHEIVQIVQKSTALLEALTVAIRPEDRGISLCDVPKLVGHAVGLFIYDMKVRQIKHELKIEDGLASLAADQGRLMRGLFYLLSNAVEEAETCAVKMIRVRVRGADDAIVVEVQNPGSTIDESVRAQMFSAGYTTKTGAHLGLGLSEALAISRYHEGDLIYDPDRGFVLTLPKANGFEL